VKKPLNRTNDEEVFAITVGDEVGIISAIGGG
jgi:hypothetical protein